MKLPAFYLLDAISKNVYDPYARRFGAIVVRLFIDTYEQVDPNTRNKMIEMLTTWRNGAPSGKELFGVVHQLAINRHATWRQDLTRTLSVHVISSLQAVQIHLQSQPSKSLASCKCWIEDVA